MIKNSVHQQQYTNGHGFEFPTALLFKMTPAVLMEEQLLHSLFDVAPTEKSPMDSGQAGLMQAIFHNHYTRMACCCNVPSSEICVRAWWGTAMLEPYSGVHSTTNPLQKPDSTSFRNFK
ncbi:hypothetical protein TNCV_5119281 [Trichonephila clavipes]|nr:hypothetical protein TNCV_5119281 [Trichonephila clavipes]